MKNPKNRAVNGVVWSAIERFSVQAIQFLVSIILARLLTPTDFGIVAIVLIFSTIFQTINEAGFNTALVHKQNRDNLDYSTAFVANILIGVVSYLILFFVAPYISEFYDIPELTNIMRLLSLNLIINSFSLVPIAIFTIRIDFKTQARASLVSAILSGICGIIIAYNAKNAYAIVAQQISFSLCYTFLLIIFSHYKISLKFSTQRFKFLFGYASKLIGARVISVIFDDIYSLAIGKLYAPNVLGCYNRAQSFQQILSKNIINIVQRVSVPILCEAQNDIELMKKVLIKFLTNTALVVYPILALLMVLSQPIVLIVLGDKWIEVSSILKYVCPIGFFYLISTFNRNIYNATGRTDLAFKTEIIKKCLFVLVFIITMNHSIRVLLIGLIAISIIEMIIDVAMVTRQIGLTLITELKSLMGIICSTALMSTLIHFLTYSFDDHYIQISIGATSGIILYLTTCYLFNISNFRTEIKNYVNKNHR